MKRFLVAANLAFLLAAGASRAAGAPDVDDDNATVQVVPAQHALLVTGVIGNRFESDIRAALDRNPDTQRLIVNGPGGMRAQALRVAELANRRGLAVRVSGRCASACALMWAAANTREMTFDSGLGLHRSALDPSLALPDVVRQKLMAHNDRQTDDVLRRAGFPERVIAVGASTPSSAMSWFSPYELKTGGVPFQLLDTTGHAASLDARSGRLVRGAVADASRSTQ
ncbi:hypothetical protein DWG18_02800 [Lysobacter sp. TY2-98]|uniref:hypothetical protein n=1 Tax=Lysobacter sp. TY2-98 TaxID=2290922 RepID=UPI000E203E22|nr:hypothetical protein [Lysobacter sp. TY2-98]AXK71320.1 hypothetical protein DWG18_02800 [Lysobacter sp. TY2-98]